MDASLILEKLFSRSSFYDIPCFSILASGTHLHATICTLLQRIFSEVPVLVLLYSAVDHLY